MRRLALIAALVATVAAAVDDLPSLARRGLAYEFGGVDEYISVGDNDAFSLNGSGTDTPCTIAAWVNMDDATAFRIVSKYGVSGSREWLFSVSGGDLLTFSVHDSANNFVGRSTPAVTSREGGWMHVCATYTGSRTAGGFAVYIDGVRADNGDFNSGTFTAAQNTATPVEVGGISAIASYADGKISDAMIWDVALSADQVRGLYEDMGGKYRDEVADLSGNGNDGDPQGGVSFGGGVGVFDGVDDYVDVPQAAFVSGSAPRTFACWALFDNYDSNQYLFTGGTGVDGQQWLPGFFLTDSAIEYVWGGHRYGTTNKPSAGEWHHFAFIVPSGATTTDDALIYIDGVNEPLTTLAGSPQTLNTVLGGFDESVSSSIASSGIDGTITQSRIYSRAITSNEVATLHAAERQADIDAIDTTGLELFYDFNGGYPIGTEVRYPLQSAASTNIVYWLGDTKTVYTEGQTIANSGPINDNSQSKITATAENGVIQTSRATEN